MKKGIFRIQRSEDCVIFTCHIEETDSIIKVEFFEDRYSPFTTMNVSSIIDFFPLNRPMERRKGKFVKRSFNVVANGLKDTLKAFLRHPRSKDYEHGRSLNMIVIDVLDENTFYLNHEGIINSEEKLVEDFFRTKRKGGGKVKNRIIVNKLLCEAKINCFFLEGTLKSEIIKRLGSQEKVYFEDMSKRYILCQIAEVMLTFFKIGWSARFRGDVFSASEFTRFDEDSELFDRRNDVIRVMKRRLVTQYPSFTEKSYGRDGHFYQVMKKLDLFRLQHGVCEETKVISIFLDFGREEDDDEKINR